LTTSYHLNKKVGCFSFNSRAAGTERGSGIVADAMERLAIGFNSHYQSIT